MLDAWSLTAIAVGALCSAAWIYVGVGLLQRPAKPAHRGATRAFAAAWLAAGAFSAVHAASIALSSDGPLPPGYGLALAWFALVVGVVVVGGVVAYLGYLLTGKPWIVRVVAAAYAAQLLVLAAIIESLHPVDAGSTAWSVRFTFAQDVGAIPIALAIVLFAPAVLASLRYLALVGRVEGATARWRVGFVGGGILFWSVAAILFRVPMMSTATSTAARAAAIVASILVFLAYAPPGWARRRFGVGSLREEVVRVPLDAARREKQRRELAERARDLI